MDTWAKQGKYDCHFICVCVLGDRSAQQLSAQFGNELKLQYCVNTFVDNPLGLPDYGQLGCQGFIVMDASHNVVSTQTSAYMQVRSLAFAHVESLLDALSSQRQLPAVCPGEYVKLVSGEPGMSGATALCLRTDPKALQVQVLTGTHRGTKATLPPSAVSRLGDETGPRDEETGPLLGSGERPCGAGGGSPCGPGGCAIPLAARNDGECDASLDDDYVASRLDLVSVRVPSMDAEHAECAQALGRLVTECSGPSLEAVLKTLTDHFAHEEALFEEHGFGAHQDKRFSAKATHIEDHGRILTGIREQLGSGTEFVPRSFVRDLLRDFHEHTSRYDVQYSELLSSAGAM